MKQLRKLMFCTLGIFTVTCMSAIVSHAATGDIAGHIYSTDIRAYINDIEVPSYNIGGKTVVVIEDITKHCSYNDELRVLSIDGSDFKPRNLKYGSSERSDVPGNIVGDIYETDIKTIFYDTEIMSYNLGGKTAVALEDLGGFGEYNELGARYFYNDKKRKIRFETLYNNASESVYPRVLRLKVSNDKSQINAEVCYDLYSHSSVKRDDNFSEFENERLPRLLPVMTEINGEEKQLGWYFGHKTKKVEKIGIEVNGELLPNEYGLNKPDGSFKAVYELTDSYTGFAYLFDDIVREAKKAVVIPEISARDRTAGKMSLSKGWSEEQDKLETDDYLFIYAIGSTLHGKNTHLLLIQNDGTYHDYRDDFESDNIWGTILLDDISIDHENELCYFSDHGKNYVIDLKTGEMKER